MKSVSYRNWQFDLRNPPRLDVAARFQPAETTCTPKTRRHMNAQTLLVLCQRVNFGWHALSVLAKGVEVVQGITPFASTLRACHPNQAPANHALTQH
jgi:hypothetical protein